jgi:hypothetical protein
MSLWATNERGNPEELVKMVGCFIMFKTKLPFFELRI